MNHAISFGGAQAAQPPDADILASIASGSLTGLALLFDRYALDVRRFVARLGVAPGDVDDIVQATFLLVVNAARSFRGSGPARAWLFGLATNAVRRHRRSLARMTARATAWAREWIGDGPPTPHDSLENLERLERGARALARLSPKKREVFVLVVMEGVPAEAAAESLAVPIGTVWTRLHHARRALREYLEEASS
ncbi:MAG: RNA polymerase sigma factor [Myxococcota bacterium]|nr:RNA polymerase sigma factor [Myxococcota bacterium]